jgi:hypothetical protein
MYELITSEEVPLAAEAVWPVIGDFSGIRRWALQVAEERTETTAEGKVRVLTMADGQTFRERLVEAGEHFYTYTLDRPDMSAYFGTISVVPIDASASRIELIVRYVPKDEAASDAARDQLGKFFRGCLKAMKRALGLG